MCFTWREGASHNGCDHVKARTTRSVLGLAGLFVVGAIGPYMAANAWNAARATQDHSIRLGIDEAMPFLPWTVVIYALFFPLFLLPPALVLRRADRLPDLRVLVHTLIGFTLLHCVVFVLLPSTVPRTPTPDDVAFGSWLDLLRGTDHPWNAWPSLHVGDTLLMVHVLDRWWTADAGRRWGVTVGLYGLWVAISISTMTTEQHYLWDVLTGAVAGVLGVLWMRPRLTP